MRATTQNRQAAKSDPELAALLVEGGVQCDHCEHDADVFVIDGETARFLCPEGYLSHLRESRASRPTREQLIANVNRAVARGAA